MAPRFDGENLTLQLSVAELLDTEQLRQIGFGNRGGYERFWLGQAIHSRYQEEALARDATYRCEVHTVLELEHRGWAVTIQGRLDGLRTEADGSRVVEEIKSVRRGAQLSPATREVYARQALLYAWMLHRLDDSTEVRAELILIEIGTDHLEREEIPVDLRLLEASVRQRLNRWIKGHEEQRRAADSRRLAAGRLSFPYPEIRPGQEEITAAVETAVENREHVLVEAATGIGKTVAALYPALRYALAHEKRVFVLTAKNLQQEMAAAVLELLNQEGAFQSLRLRAKAGMCANDQLLCHEEYCPYAQDYYAKLQGSGLLARLARERSLLDPDFVFAAARADRVCPFEVSLELAKRVQVVVCDYNYAFDPYVSLSEFGPDQDLGDTLLVVDEIHNLVDRGRGYYSPELSATRARRAGELTGHGAEPIHRRIEALCRDLAELVEETVTFAVGETGTEGAVETALPDDALWILRRDFDAAFIDYLEHQRETRSFRPEDPFVEIYFDLLRFLNGLAVSDGAFSHYAQLRGGEPRIKILCKDPSRFLGGVIERTHTTVGLSATLSPPEFYRDLLGFAPGRTAHVSVPTPFPAEHRRVVIDASVATTYRERPRNYARIAEKLVAFAAAVPGNCLALFPSYQFLAEVAGLMPLSSKRVLIQQQADSPREREEILETLRAAFLGDVLLLAVAGGVFAEGVDYPGEMLKAVAVVGPCLPALTLEQNLLREYYEERFDRGFEYAFVIPGMTRVVQAAGRLIRSEDDRGVIALLDRRFLERPYVHHLPSDWLGDEGIRSLTGDPARAATEFFHHPSQRPSVAQEGEPLEVEAARAEAPQPQDSPAGRGKTTARRKRRRASSASSRKAPTKKEGG